MKKRLWSRLLSLALVAALCITLCISAAAAETVTYPTLGDGVGGGNGIRLLVSLDKDTIYTSDEEQYVTATVSLSEPLSLTAFELHFNKDKTSPFEIESIASESAEKIYPGGFSNNSPIMALFYGAFGLRWFDFEDELCTCTYKIPADVTPGTYELGLEAGSRIMGDNNPITRIIFTEVPITATLTILEAPEEEVIDATGAALSQESVSLTKGGSTTLTASLQPADTTDAISNVAWSTSNAAVATVADGKVTAVSAGEAAITAKVTTEAGKEFTATCAVTVTAAQTTESPYTVTIARNGEDVVHVGDTVAMDVTVSGGNFGAGNLKVTYDPGVFTYQNCEGIAQEYAQQNGAVCLIISPSSYEDGSIIATLKFEANSTGTGVFHFGVAQVGAAAQAVSCPQANTVSANVTVTAQHTVTFMAQDGTTVLDSVLVDEGASVTAPTAPDVEHYTFNAWTAGGVSYSTSEIEELPVTADVTYVAEYVPNTYSVTLPAGVTDLNGQSGTVEAVYNTDFVAEIVGYDPSNRSYTVTYQIDDGEPVEVTVTENGQFTIPGAAITGSVTVTMKSVPAGLTVDVYPGYVTGYTLITVAGPYEEGYTYNGQGMYWVEAYEAYAWLVKDEDGLTVEEATAAVGFGGEHTTIVKGLDINGSGDVELNDWWYVYNCYTLENSVEEQMAVFLSADVNIDHIVNVADVNVILNDIFGL